MTPNQTPISTNNVELEPTKSVAEAMKTATISDNTRSYLILLGKIQDLYGEAIDVVERDYLTMTQVERILAEYSEYLSKARSEIESLLIYSISDQMGNINSTQI